MKADKKISFCAEYFNDEAINTDIELYNQDPYQIKKIAIYRVEIIIVIHDSIAI